MRRVTESLLDNLLMNGNMFTKTVLPILALAGLFFAINRVVEARRPEPVAQPIVEPPTRPDSVKMIAGSGLVEARRENIPIGVNIPGVVTEVFVKKGEKVKSGAPLFRTDDREFKSMLAVREAELAASKAQLHKLIVSPRPEDIPPAKAAAMEAQARMDDAEAALARTERLFHRQMIAASDYDKDRYAYYAAKATYAKAKADLEKILAGSWKEDIEIARAAVQLAQSQVESIKISLERLIVRAPMDGEVLQLNVRLGQFAAMTWKEPMIVLGDSKRLHVRVDIDEPELLYFSKSAPAVATLKGRPNVRFNLRIVYVEPYVIPKQSLTGNNSERVDQRVLQVIYELADERPTDVYIGQQMDIYLRAVPPSESVAVGLGGESTKLPFEDQTPINQPAKPDA
jgi:HlyD family secretion protein